MQTFVPEDSGFRASVSVLDLKRLGKQRVEGMQILNILCLKPEALSTTLRFGQPGKVGWTGHPAVRMWRGYEGMLVRYVLRCCDVWSGMGFRDTVSLKLRDSGLYPVPVQGYPHWWGGLIHESHQYALYQKDSEFYPQYANANIKTYWWPVGKDG